MDVYPEVAVRLGEIREGSLIHRAIQNLMHWSYGQADVLVALDEDMQALFEKSGHAAAVCRPWTPLTLQWPTEDSTPAEDLPGRPLRWVYSGNLGRAHEWEALLDAQKLLEGEAPDEFELVFQGGGASRQPAQARAIALSLQHCQWSGYAPKEALLDSLFAADVLVATQNPATQGLLWPSKLAVMRHVPRPILWVGPQESAVTAELSSRPATATISVDPNAARNIANWLISLKRSQSSTALPNYSPPSPASLQQPIASLEEILSQ